MGRHLLLGLLGWLAAGAAQAQAPAWQGLLTPGRPGLFAYSRTAATVADASGNLYLCGWFGDTLRLGGLRVVSAGGVDGFVAKYSPATRQFAWVQRLGGPGDDLLTDIAVQGGAVYVAGHFNGATSTVGATTLTNYNAGGTFRTNDAFVARLTDAGSGAGFAWVQQAGGVGEDFARKVAVVGSSVYVVGDTSSPQATFGGNTITNPGGSNDFGGSYVGFVSKLTDGGTAGSFGWLQSLRASSFMNAMCLAVQGSSVYVAGEMQGTATLGSLTLSSGAGTGSDVYVAKLTDAGSTSSYVWARADGGAASDVVHSLAVAGANVYLGGTYFDAPTRFGTTTLPNAGRGDLFLARYTDTGTTAAFAWALGAGSNSTDYANALLVSGSDVYLTGYFQGPQATFGPYTLASTSFKGYDSAVLYVTRVADVGTAPTFAWVQTAGGEGEARGTGLALTAAGLFVGGSLTAPARFGSFGVAAPNQSTLGFLATFAPGTMLAAAGPAPVAAAPTLAPNPAHGTTTLLGATGPVQKLTLLDALGRVVRTFPGAPSPVLDLAGLAPGPYLLRVEAPGGTTMRQLLVE